LAVIFHLGNANPTRRAGPPFSPDRTNLAFAAVGLRRDLGLSLAQYGLGSSLLFATYCLAQLPIAMLGARVGLLPTLHVHLLLVLEFGEGGLFTSARAIGGLLGALACTISLGVGTLANAIRS
jgi:sugar phosphate permease